MLSRQLAFEWGPRGIRSNAIAQGSFEPRSARVFLDTLDSPYARAWSARLSVCPHWKACLSFHMGPVTHAPEVSASIMQHITSTEPVGQRPRCAGLFQTLAKCAETARHRIWRSAIKESNQRHR
jgi:NAD(P)-dependent dehydrogenase (short-subunit alcohol dehydrogenase family)